MLGWVEKRKKALWREYETLAVCIKGSTITPKRFYLQSIKSDIKASWELLVVGNLKKGRLRWAWEGLKDFLTNVADYLIVRFSFPETL